MSEVMLAVEGLRFAYRKGGVELFDGFSHEFAPAQVSVVTGVSGRGKSTLLYLLGLLLTPVAGRVRFAGRDLTQTSDAERAQIRAGRVGFVFQDSELDPARPVISSVLEPALYAGRSRKAMRGRALELLERFGLGERAEHKPGQVSGGQAQRLALCRALLLEPDVILADEPTGNLDRENAGIVLDALRDAAHTQGSTVVIASHDPFVLEQADQVVTL
ncbi:MAG: ATP-binding cassette domain-containing protein [Propionibacteriaceae bacterium]|nr:ATP-binding cassette domain-containing protein [Propionibacteriaceae bacterium]